jgi:lipid-A-disaccharide synthase
MAKIYIIAGEDSGDFIGGAIVKHLKDIYPSKLDFVGIGGSFMGDQGIKSLFPIYEINLIGFFEIVPHIFRLCKLIARTVDDIIKQAPDLLITIDSPGFTYRVAKKIRRRNPNIKILHIVAPSVWAYKPSRAMKYAKIYDHLFTLLPFEPSYFQKLGLNTSYIGHPVLEQRFYSDDKEQIRQELRISENATIITVTPGSRRSEIIMHMTIFCESLNIVAQKCGNLEVIFVLANSNYKDLIKSFLTNAKFNFSFSYDRLKSYGVADIALAKSGTNTVEIAASKTPMIVAYKLNIISYLLVKLFIKIKYISLINIITNKAIIPEYIQSNCNINNISSAIINLLWDPEKSQNQLDECQKALNELGFQSEQSPSFIAAQIIKQEFLDKLIEL